MHSTSMENAWMGRHLGLRKVKTFSDILGMNTSDLFYGGLKPGNHDEA